jgi:transposase
LVAFLQNGGRVETAGLSGSSTSGSFVAAGGELVAAAGCALVFLPAYSPELSPIEEAFSKVKALVKAAAARTRAAWTPRSPPHWTQRVFPGNGRRAGQE